MHSSIPSIQQRLRTFSQQYSRVEGSVQSLTRRFTEVEKEHVAADNNMLVYSRARTLLEILVQSSEQHIKQYIEPIVTEALRYVFCKEIFFHVIFMSRRNQIENDFIILRGPEQEVAYQKCIADRVTYEKEFEALIKGTRDLDFMNGGAVSQVLAAVLKLTVCELLEITGPVCLDEPSSMVGAEYTSRFGQLLYSLSRKFNRQLVIITHSDTLASFGDVVYRIKQDSTGVSTAVIEKES